MRRMRNSSLGFARKMLFGVHKQDGDIHPGGFSRCGRSEKMRCLMLPKVCMMDREHRTNKRIGLIESTGTACSKKKRA